ncbi:hypothetical protein [Glutamicibacter sp.]|uniref:hypothetical protein n=1 Tax=Glutamicibacter sp. TaxID=1931995 RepID=UPI002FDB6756
MTVALFLAGCGIFEAAAGVKKNPDGTVTTNGTGGVVGAVLNYFLPGAGALVAAGATYYARRANVAKAEAEKAAVTTFKAIESYDDPDLKKLLASYHSTAGVQGFVNGVLVKEGINT